MQVPHFLDLTNTPHWFPKLKRRIKKLLLSTMYHDKAVDKKSGKPEIIVFHDTTKGAVDKLHSHRVQRKQTADH